MHSPLTLPVGLRGFGSLPEPAFEHINAKKASARRPKLLPLDFSDSQPCQDTKYASSDQQSAEGSAYDDSSKWGLALGTSKGSPKL